MKLAYLGIETQKLRSFVSYECEMMCAIRGLLILLFPFLTSNLKLNDGTLIVSNLFKAMKLLQCQGHAYDLFCIFKMVICDLEIVFVL